MRRNPHDDGRYAVRISRGWHRFWFFVAFPSPGYLLLGGAITDVGSRSHLFWIGLILVGILLPLAAGTYRGWTELGRYPDAVVATVNETGVGLRAPAAHVPWARIRELVVFRLYNHSGELPALCWFLVVVERDGPRPGAPKDRDPRTWGISRQLPGRVNIKALTTAVAHHSRTTVRHLGTIDNVRADHPIGSVPTDSGPARFAAAE